MDADHLASWLAQRLTTAIIRQSEKTNGHHIPIIAMTAHAMDGDRQRFIESGMDGYVSKPIRSRELFETIESLLAPGKPAAVRQQPCTSTPSCSE